MKWAQIIVSLFLASGCVMLGTAHVSAQEAAHTAASLSWSEEKWSEEKWPFPIDQWGIGQAFGCAAERCGGAAHLYLRAKVGFCRCATGVSDDDEIERIGDLDLFGPDYKGLAPGHSVTAGTMSGRARLFTVERPLQPALPVLEIALAHKCDAIVATVIAGAETQSVIEAQALDLLRSAAVAHWVEAQGGSE